MTFSRQIKTFLFFIVAAPPIAAIPLAVLFMIPSPRLSIISLLFSYIIGVVPAGVAGATFILVSRWLGKEKWLLTKHKVFLLGACCGVVGVLFSFTLFSIISDSTSNSNAVTSLSILLFPLGFLSGGICGVLSMRLLDEKFTSFSEFKNSTIGGWLIGMLFVVFFILALSLVGLNDKT
jgi:hypothetical protein